MLSWSNKIYYLCLKVEDLMYNNQYLSFDWVKYYFRSDIWYQGKKWVKKSIMS
jgi:hypothetical protein